jgi:hypothetical protein
MSLSLMRAKPSIDEPSNMISLLYAFSSWLNGNSTHFGIPRTSTNWSWR